MLKRGTSFFRWYISCIVLKGIALIVLSFRMLPIEAQNHASKASYRADRSSVSLDAPSLGTQKKSAAEVQPEGQEHLRADVVVLSTPKADPFHDPGFWVNISLAIAGFGAIAVGVFTLKKIKVQADEMRLQRQAMQDTLTEIRRQADLMEAQVKDSRASSEESSKLASATLEAIRRQGLSLKRQTTIHRNAAEAALMQAQHLINSERPFVMIETRGPRGTEFWMRNCGKSPAQIVFCDPVLNVEYPDFVQGRQTWVLPQPPYYGLYYDDPRAVQINVPWLAPGEERRITVFDPSVFDELSIEQKSALSSGHRQVRIYSAIKYRGIYDDEVFESRFCYGWDQVNGTRMAGDVGYNQYT